MRGHYISVMTTVHSAQSLADQFRTSLHTMNAILRGHPADITSGGRMFFSEDAIKALILDRFGGTEEDVQNRVSVADLERRGIARYLLPSPTHPFGNRLYFTAAEAKEVEKRIEEGSL